MRQSMSYGVMPSKDDFEAAFEAKCPNGKFAFGNDKIVGTDKLTCTQLWDELQKQRNRWENFPDDEDDDGSKGDQAGDWCSCVLSVLGFEWI